MQQAHDIDAALERMTAGTLGGGSKRLLRDLLLLLAWPFEWPALAPHTAVAVPQDQSWLSAITPCVAESSGLVGRA